MAADRQTIYRLQEMEWRLTNADRTLGTSLIRPRNDPVSSAPFWVRLTSIFDATTGYNWKAQKPNAEYLQDATITGSYLFEANKNKLRQINDKVRIVVNGVTGDGHTTYLIVSDLPGELFPVIVAYYADGANGAGDKTHACTYTYTVNDIAGNLLGTGLVPQWGRPTVGKMTVATRGTAYYEQDGDLILWQVNEWQYPGAC